MTLSRLGKRLLGWMGRPLQSAHSPEAKTRGAVAHVIILDGTMSTLQPGRETHAGQTYRMLSEMGPQVSVFYEAGIQLTDTRSALDVLMGRGINRQIRRAYGYLSSRYRPGDRIYLMGYSRGAFAVRSLAGVIDMVGLLRSEHATVRNIRTAYRYYQCNPASETAATFAKLHCHSGVQIEMVGVWDTVKALGMRLPLLWRLTETRHDFHNHTLGPAIRNGFHALALDETREVFEPILWDCPPGGWTGRVEQVWFKGTHGDVGGQLGGFEAARPLANISLIWMLEQAERCGLPLPRDWASRFPTDINAPSVGTWRGWGKIFLFRRRRKPGQTRIERIHESVGTAAQKSSSLPFMASKGA